MLIVLPRHDEEERLRLWHAGQADALFRLGVSDSGQPDLSHLVCSPLPHDAGDALVKVAGRLVEASCLDGPLTHPLADNVADDAADDGWTDHATESGASLGTAVSAVLGGGVASRAGPGGI